MMGWLVRLLFVVAGAITSLFVSTSALNFAVIQTVIVVLLFTLLVVVIAFWPTVKKFFTRQ